MKILVAGSNQNGNDQVKEKAMKILEDLDHKVSHSCDIFRSYTSPLIGNKMVINRLRESDVYYIVCSKDGYVGLATAARAGAAYCMPGLTILSSHQIADPDIAFYVEAIVKPENVGAYFDIN